MKSQYSLAKSGQLIITRGKKKIIPRGYFSVSTNNELIYFVTEPFSWRRLYGVDERIAFKGAWRMDRQQRLLFQLKKTNTQAGNEQLVLKTQLHEAKANTLVFSLSTHGKKSTHTVRFLELRGRWQADTCNRLQFLVKRLRSSSDTLTLSGAWQVKKNTLSYTYKKSILKTKTRHVQMLRFKGYWDITGRNRLTYILDTKNNSAFDFRAYCETPNLIGKRGVIKYRFGIGAKGSILFKTQIISLYGVWKLHRKTGLSLVMDYGDGMVKEIRFGAFVRIKEKNKITLDLRSRKGNDFGISLTLSRSFLKSNAEWFLRLMSERKQPRLACGIIIRW